MASIKARNLINKKNTSVGKKNTKATTEKSPANPMLIGFFVFVVVGSAFFQIMNVLIK